MSTEVEVGTTPVVVTGRITAKNTDEDDWGGVWTVVGEGDDNDLDQRLFELYGAFAQAGRPMNTRVRVTVEVLP